MSGFSFKVKKVGFSKAPQRLFDGVERVKRQQWQIVRKAALLMERELKKGIRSGAPGGKKFKPLSPITMQLRRGRKPLIDTGALLGSINTTFDQNRLLAFVGVHRKSSRRGYSNFNVAIAHEFGTKPFVIRVNDRVRALFWYLNRVSNGRINPLSPNKTTILHPGVPARPFVRPTIAKMTPQLQAVLAKAWVQGRLI